MKTKLFLISLVSLILLIGCSTDDSYSNDNIIDQNSELNSTKSSEKTIRDLDAELCDEEYLLFQLEIVYEESNIQGSLEDRLRRIMKYRRTIKHLYRPTPENPCPDIRMPYGSCRYQKRTGCIFIYRGDFYEYWDVRVGADIGNPGPGGKRSKTISIPSSEL